MGIIFIIIIYFKENKFALGTQYSIDSNVKNEIVFYMISKSYPDLWICQIMKQMYNDKCVANFCTISLQNIKC